MQRAKIKEAQERVGLCQKLYEEGKSLDEIAERTQKSRATASLNALGFTNHRQYRTAIDTARKGYEAGFSENLSRLRKIEFEIEGIETTKKGVRIAVKEFHKSEDIEENFQNSISQSIVFLHITDIDVKDFRFNYEYPNLSIFPKPIRGITPIKQRAYIEAYAYTFLMPVKQS